MLAQEWLYGSRVPSKYDSYVERHLALPTTLSPHSTHALLNRIAERIVFTDDVPSMLYDMYENKQLTYEGMIASAKLPYDVFWLEYNTYMASMHSPKDEITSIGALIQRIGTEAVRMFILVGLKMRDRVEFHSTLAYVIDFDEWPPVTTSLKREDKWALKFSVRYAFNMEKLLATSDIDFARQGQLSEIGSMVSEIIFGIFLITQPKVYSVEQVKWKPSHAAKRAKANKPPLLEYKRLRIRIGKHHKRYEQRPASAYTRVHTDTESAEAVQHRRYHKVMGHFRHYINCDEPHTTWIESHYRGDPALGVTFTERDVSK